MLFGNDRNQIRNHYIQAWQKFQQKKLLEPLESLLVEIIQQHPEYHAFLEDSDSAIAKDFTPEMGQGNPFLHMGMHIAIREQLDTDRPAGFREAYQALAKKTGESHETEHQIMECLGVMMWQAQRNGGTADENAYLEAVRQLAGNHNKK